MRLEIEISDREAELLRAWPLPAEQCGPHIEERVRFLIDDMCLTLEAAAERRARAELYRKVGLPPPGDDDDIGL